MRKKAKKNARRKRGEGGKLRVKAFEQFTNFAYRKRFWKLAFLFKFKFQFFKRGRGHHFVIDQVIVKVFENDDFSADRAVFQFSFYA